MIRESSKRDPSVRRALVAVDRIMREKAAYEKLKKEMPQMAYTLADDNGQGRWLMNLVKELEKLYDKGYEAATKDNEELK